MNTIFRSLTFDFFYLNLIFELNSIVKRMASSALDKHFKWRKKPELLKISKMDSRFNQSFFIISLSILFSNPLLSFIFLFIFLCSSHFCDFFMHSVLSVRKKRIDSDKYAKKGIFFFKVSMNVLKTLMSRDDFFVSEKNYKKLFRLKVDFS